MRPSWNHSSPFRDIDIHFYFSHLSVKAIKNVEQLYNQYVGSSSLCESTTSNANQLNYFSLLLPFVVLKRFELFYLLQFLQLWWLVTQSGVPSTLRTVNSSTRQQFLLSLICKMDSNHRPIRFVHRPSIQLSYYKLFHVIAFSVANRILYVRYPTPLSQ